VPRFISSRLQIAGTLVTETALHVGGQWMSADTDLPLARNGRDELYIPGTSIAGVIRSWCENHFRNQNDKRQIHPIVPELFGPKSPTSETEVHASFVIVDDIALPDETQCDIRDSVGIDRIYGTAAEHAKFDRAILPRGIGLSFKMTVEVGKNHSANESKALISELLAALSKSRLRLGGAKTRGLGCIKLKDCSITEEYLHDRESVIRLLKHEVSAKSFASWLTEFQQSLTDVNEEDRSRIDSLRPLQSQLHIKIKWEPKYALMVKASYDGIGVDVLPLTSGNGKDQVSLVLPGSSIKGAFRAQSERIVRTMKSDEFHREADFHKQIKVELVEELFGAKKESPGDKDTEPQKERLGLGALSIDDCYFGKQMNLTDWQAVETGKTTVMVKGKEQEVNYTEQELWQALKKIEGSSNDLSSPTREFAIAHHVAIDRWTGSASDGALFSELQPTVKTGWDDICLTLDFSRLRTAEGDPDEPLRRRCLMLLLLVLRDFAENRLPLGFGTNRGMGEVENVSFNTSGFYDIKWDQGKLVFNDPKLKSDLEKEWNNWLNQN
jgi:CRISPR/Cas system CSM-associated protein Csm3 (group 7 of RAMP superfamily)